MKSNALSVGILLLVAPDTFGALRPADPRYEVNLFAEPPDIVTPIGATVDREGRLYVIESHTLTPPEDYQGPKDDRIKVFEDEDLDGNPERVTIFAEALESALRLAFSPEGSLYVGCSKGIWRLSDTDRDGRAEGRERIIEFESEDPFPWGYLGAMTFSAEGDLYFIRGFASFPHQTKGSDGSLLSGYGDGAAVLRCRSDGAGLESLATGFWAVPALSFDPEGRLLLVDNDPLSRGPNRLIHCVEQGDYGFRILYGFGGNFPLLGLSGELAGTLRPISPTGESPSDLLICANARFPEDMGRSVLIALWGSNAIERHELETAGSTLTSTRSLWLQGAEDFKPVALAVHPAGIIYVTDWVRNDFRNHGQGRIWRMAPRSEVQLEAPMKHAPPLELHLPSSPEAISAGLRSQEPLDRHLASRALAQPGHEMSLQALARSPDPLERLGALVAFRKSAPRQPPSLLAEFLADPDEGVRHAAVVWVGESRLTQFREELLFSLVWPEITARLLQASLAALAALDPGFVKACENEVGFPWEQLPETLPDATTHPLLSNQGLPAGVRVKVLPWLKDPSEDETRALLRRLTKQADPPLNLAALEILSDHEPASLSEWLRAVAADVSEDTEVRAQALATWAPAVDGTEILPFLADEQEAIQVEAVIALQKALAAGHERKGLIRRHLEALESEARARVQAEVRFVLDPGKQERPSDLKGWQRLLGSGGNPAAGRRRFFSANAQCSTCHSIRSRGARVGPDLGMISGSQTREEIIRSIIQPSDYFAPEYQTWEVDQNDGQVFSGALLGVAKDGAVTLMLPTGEIRSIPKSKVGHLRGLTTSVMPDGLEAAWSLESVRDVVAFLSTMQ